MRAPEPDDVRVAAIVALVLTVVLAAAAWQRPASAGELAHADPVVPGALMRAAHGTAHLLIPALFQ